MVLSKATNSCTLFNAIISKIQRKLTHRENIHCRGTETVKRTRSALEGERLDGMGK